MQDFTLFQKFIIEDTPVGEHKIIIYQVFTRLFGNKQQNQVKNGSLIENGVGKFADFDEKALGAIKDLGITHIWYTGVLEHATMTDYSDYGISVDHPQVVKGRAGSPYAIKDYYDVNPDLALDVTNRMQEFEQLVARTHQQGLKVIIDFVPNHVARHYASDAKPAGVVDLGAGDDHRKPFDPNNNFYWFQDQEFKVPEGYEPPVKSSQPYREVPAKATGNNVFRADPSIHDWFETVKLNYGVDYTNQDKINFDPVPDTWHKMKDILVFWTNKGVDGFRCDMAEMVPVEFWQWVIPQVKQVNPEILFIAEIYNPARYRDYIEQGKFDYLYDKVQLYDTIRHIMEGKSQNTAGISDIIRDLKGIHPYLLRFQENHDEQRIASSFFAGDAQKGLPAMAINSLVHSGPVMVYFGQEVGEPGMQEEGFSGEDGRTTIFDYWGVPEHQKWMNGGEFDGGGLSQEQKTLRENYRKLLHYAANQPLIMNGKLLDNSALQRNLGEPLPEAIYAFTRFGEEKAVLVVTNFSDQPEKVKLRLPIKIFTENTFGKWMDWDGNEAQASREEDFVVVETEVGGWSFVMVDSPPS